MADINRLNIAELKELCREKDLPVFGTKKTLKQRLTVYFRDNPVQNPPNNQRQNEDGNGNNDGDGNDDDGSSDENSDGSGNSDGERQQRRTKKSTFSFKDIEESLEKFDGDHHKDVNQWIADFEAQATIFGWGDLEKLVYARRLLTGSAKLYASCELRPKKWKELKKGLIEEFKVVVNSALVHKKLSETKKKKDESFREYCYRMIDIATPAKIETAAVITYVVDGIQDSTANKMFLYSTKSRNRKFKMVANQ